jgi:GH15 family glucan-1,4-alpha-glucosidase
VRRRYRHGTLVLETEFESGSGRATVVDFMPPADGAHLVRIVVGQAGRLDFATEIVARFDYGATVPWVTRRDDGALDMIAGPERLMLRTSVALRGEDLRTIGGFSVAAGETVAFVLSYGASHEVPPPAIDALAALERTEVFWRKWSDRCPEVGPWTDAVKRSLVTLKALTYAPTGGIASSRRRDWRRRWSDASSYAATG